MTEMLPGVEEPSKVAPVGYTVLARRYRSREFDEVVGQREIAQTLKNAIAKNRIAHAYLFTGTRGVGKTSMARIFAKALNATDDLRERDAIAEAILRGDDMDVIEIDGASNRGIDEVRDLIANAGLTPARCPYKVYIIDEVHMLTGPAFNALLKTMEEPPRHVKFILCTTEVHKVPATIQSRCQRFDFRNIPVSEIARHLASVVERENLHAETLVINEVARLANGSMRDGLSLLDRLIAAGDGSLTEDLLNTMLGTPDHALVGRLVDAFAAGDAKGALETSAELLASGSSIEQATDVLVDHLRNVMVVTTCGADSPLLELFGEAREAAVRQAASFDAASLTYMILLCEGASQSIRRSNAARAIFEALMVRLSMTEQVAMIPSLLSGARAPAPTPSQKKSEPHVTAAPRSPAAGEAAGAASAERRTSRAEVEEVKSIPAVRTAIDLFNGEVVSVRKAPSESSGEGEHDV